MVHVAIVHAPITRALGAVGEAALARREKGVVFPASRSDRFDALRRLGAAIGQNLADDDLETLRTRLAELGGVCVLWLTDELLTAKVSAKRRGGDDGYINRVPANPDEDGVA